MSNRRSRLKINSSFEDIAELFDKFPKNVEKLTFLEALSVDGILRKFHVKDVLDCACGTGVPSLGLAKMGYNVCASDISPKMINIVKKKARDRSIKISAKVSDFRNLRAWKGKKFDAVICTGNSLPLVDSNRDMLNAIKSMRMVLRSKGIIVLGLHNYELLCRRNELIKIRKLDLPNWVQFDVRNFGRKRVRITYFITRKLHKNFLTTISMKSSAYISPREGAKLLKSAGLKNIKTYDTRGLGPYRGEEWGFAVGFNQ